MRSSRLVVVLSVAVSAFLALGPTASSFAAELEQVSSFGTNPGGLRMFRHAPPQPKARAPLVVALHGCMQTARDYAQVGWNELADELGFYVLYPEQTVFNNPARCFRWFDAWRLERGQSENQSIVEMVERMKADFAIDPARIYVTGLSAGAAETLVLLAAWPDVFAAGAPIAGVPFHCASYSLEAGACMNPGKDRAPEDWAQLVLDAAPDDNVHTPRVSIWQGTADAVVKPTGAREIVEQWTALHGLSSVSPSVTNTVEGMAHAVYKTTSGRSVVETYEVPGMGHGTPVDPAGGCGEAGPYVLDEGVCSSRLIAQFFGLTRASGKGDLAEGDDELLADEEPQVGEELSAAGGCQVVPGRAPEAILGWLAGLLLAVGVGIVRRRRGR